MKNWIKAGSLLLCFLLSGCIIPSTSQEDVKKNTVSETSGDFSEHMVFSGQPYVMVHENLPDFSESDLSEESFENYSDLDELGRCGTAYANIGSDLMPTEERGSISQVKPSGWHSVRYDNVDGNSLYNRCHLIGWQLTAENANEKNLITGTRYLNVEGMLPFENMVADYIKETDNHVLYRVTPVYEGNNLVASGVEMEAMSVEDCGEGISFHVYCFNVQPGIVIDYETGDSYQNTGSSSEQQTYILNRNTKKFHTADCLGIQQMNPKNKQEYTGTRNDLIMQGYEPCKQCHP